MGGVANNGTQGTKPASQASLQPQPRALNTLCSTCRFFGHVVMPLFGLRTPCTPSKFRVFLRTDRSAAAAPRLDPRRALSRVWRVWRCRAPRAWRASPRRRWAARPGGGRAPGPGARAMGFSHGPALFLEAKRQKGGLKKLGFGGWKKQSQLLSSFC